MSLDTIKLSGQVLSAEFFPSPSNRNMLRLFKGEKYLKSYLAGSLDQAKSFFEHKDAEELRHKEAMATRRQERAEQRKVDTAKMLEAIKPGTLLHGSWGYEQTQCELYEVLSVKGTKVTIQAVSYRSEPTGPMSENRFAIKGSYLGEAKEMRISSGGVKYSAHCWLTPSDWAKGYYCSWYY